MNEKESYSIPESDLERVTGGIDWERLIVDIRSICRTCGRYGTCKNASYLHRMVLGRQWTNAIGFLMLLESGKICKKAEEMQKLER